MVGGSGERLWPLSRMSFPKQFNNFLSRKSLFQETIQRFKKNKIIAFELPIIITNNQYRFIVKEQLDEIKFKVQKIIVEPSKKNTAPPLLAISLIKKNTLILMVPCDHIINNTELFLRDLKYAVDNYNENKLTVFGILPNRVETGYGYIKVNEESNGKLNFLQFIEKPNLLTAKRYFRHKNYLWNSGLLLFKSSLLTKLFNKFESQMINEVKDSIQKGYQDLHFFRLDEKSWNKCTDISIDYAILEKTKEIFVIKSNFFWSDLGDWSSVLENADKTNSGMFEYGRVTSIDCKNSLLYSSDKNQLIGAVGLNNTLVVSMKDAVLVVDKNKSQDVKKLVSSIKRKKEAEALFQKKDYRPWGNFESLLVEKNFHVKILTILPGESLSLQKHKYRAENWVVVKGKAYITLNNEKKTLNVGESVFIPKKAMHRLENKGVEILQIIEVQTGNYFGEDDIERIDDKYSR